MRLLSLILSVVMAINSIPCTSLYAKPQLDRSDDELSGTQKAYTGPAAPYKGTDDFKEIIERGGFVDKSLFIKAILEDNHKALLITRPRRWGKTLNMSMLKYFFVPEMNEEGQRVFEDDRKNTKLFMSRNINGGYLDTREILKRLLLGQCVESYFADDEERIFDILEGIDFEGKDRLLKSYKGKTLKDKSPLKEAVAKYGANLALQFHGIESLLSLLNGLNDLDEKVRSVLETDKNKAQTAYNKEFGRVQRQIQMHIENNPDLKKELSKEFDLMSRHQGKHPTVLLSFADIKESTYQALEDQLRSRISQVFGEYPYILSGLHKQSKDDSDYARQKNAQQELEKFNSILGKKSSDVDLKDSLRFLSELLYKYHKKRTYILIDEYDTPLNKAYKERYDDKALDLMRSIFSPAFKGNMYLEKGILTGVLRVAKASLFSGLNNLGEDSILSSQFFPYYGFTDDEVDALLDQYSLQEQREEVRAWYGGYTIEGINFYNPFSIVSYLSQKGRLDTYWLNTGGTELIDETMLSDSTQEHLEKLRGGDFIETGITRDFTYFTLGNIDFVKDSESARIFWSLLLHAGYLTVVPESLDLAHLHSRPISLKTPNQEVQELYKGFFNQWLMKPRNVEALNQACGSIIANQIFNAILAKDVPTLTRIVSHHPSFADVEDWRFHFLDIAAMVGDNAIFQCLLKNYEKLINVRDREGLGIGDYAFLGGSNFTLPCLGEQRSTLSQPSTFQEVVCLGGGKVTLALGIFSYPAKKMAELGWRVFLQQARPIALKAGIISAVTWVTTDAMKRYLLIPFCSDYEHFYNTNISTPITFNSLLQFERYLIENREAYVTLNGPCKKGDEKMAEIKRSPFITGEDNPLHQIAFTLCQPVTDAGLSKEASPEKQGSDL